MKYSWKELYSKLEDCRLCGLCEKRTNIAIGEGNPHATIMFIGEGPGREEDLQGRPFVGPAGQLLDKMLAAIDIKREQVYIANIVKCRPPANREPTEEEAKTCMPFLREQFALVQPKIIVCLGATAAKYVIHQDIRITRDRGKWFEKKDVCILPTFHPAALLRDPSKKRQAWEDMKALRAKLDELTADAGVDADAADKGADAATTDTGAAGASTADASAADADTADAGTADANIADAAGEADEAKNGDA